MRRNSRPCSTSPGAGRTPWRHGPRSTCKRPSGRSSSRARDGRSCPDLATLLADWDGRLTVQTGKLTARHIEHCDTCARHKPGTLRPEVLSGLLPLAALPIGLRAPILQHGARVAASSAATPRGPLLRRAGALGLTCFQRARTFRGWSRVRANPGAATAIAAVALWIVAATSATLITVTGVHADAARSGNPRGSAVPSVTASPRIGRRGVPEPVAGRERAGRHQRAGRPSVPTVTSVPPAAAVPSASPAEAKPSQSAMSSGAPSPTPTATPTPTFTPL